MKSLRLTFYLAMFVFIFQTSPLAGHQPIVDANDGPQLEFGPEAELSFEEEAYSLSSETFDQADSSLLFLSSILWTDANDVVVDGDYAYCAFRNGLVIYDVSDPANPHIVTKFTPEVDDPYCISIYKLGDYLYYALYYSGLLIFDVSDPYNPFVAGESLFEGNLREIHVDGGYAFLADFYEGLIIMDVGDPTNPFKLSSLPLPGELYGIDVADTLIYAASGDSGLYVVSVADPTSPDLVNNLIMTDRVEDVYFQDDLAYVCVDYNGLFILDAGNPMSLSTIGSASILHPHSVIVQDSLAFLDANDLYVVNVADPAAPYVTDSFDTYIDNLDVHGNLIFYVGGYYGFHIYDFSDPADLQFVGSDETSGSVRVQCVDDSIAYLGCWNYGIRTVDISDPYNPEVIGGYYDVDLDLGYIAAVNGYIYTIGEKGFSIFDANNPASPEQTANIYDSTNDALAMAVQNNLAVLAYRYNITIYDVSDPYIPDSIGAYAYSYFSILDKIFFADSLLFFPGELSDGIEIINIADPQNPQKIGEYSHDPYPGLLRTLFVKDNIIYLGTSSDVILVDISDPTSPFLLGEITDVPGPSNAMYVSDSTLYRASGTQGIVLINVANEEIPYLRSVYKTPYNARDISVSDSLIYVADYGSFVVYRETSWVGTPDLIIDSLDVVEFTPDSITFFCRLKNDGSYSINLEGLSPDNSDNVKISAYISADSTPGNADDYYVGDFNIKDSPAGYLVPREYIDLTISSFAVVDTSTHHFLVVSADPGNIVEESDETNNVETSIIGYFCYPDLPDPILVAEPCGDIRYTSSGAVIYDFDFNVPNWAEFPDELFKASPDLPPCGLNTNASRTWVRLYGNDGSYLYGFCGFNEAEDLDLVWFGESNGSSIPDSVYLVINDRRCDITYQSATIDITHVGFPPIISLEGGPVEIVLYEDEPICGQAFVSNADTAYPTPGAVWEDNWLCFEPDNSGYYTVGIRANNSCGSKYRYTRYDVEIRFVRPTYEWINIYCGAPALNGINLLPGDTIEAYDPDGVLCGRDFVREDGSFGFMPVYRDDSLSEDVDEGAEVGDTISFKINSQDVITAPVIWTGLAASYEVCQFYTEQCKTFNLKTGWNLISWNLNYAEQIEQGINGIADCISVIQGFDRGGLTYCPDLPQFSTLQNLDYHYGYWFAMECDADLEICGIPIGSDDAIIIYSGWNLVSYWPQDSMTVEDGMSSILGCLNVVLGYDDGAQTWSPETIGFNSLEYLKPGFGYWAKSDCDTLLLYEGYTYNDPFPLASLKPTDINNNHTSRSWLSIYGSNIKIDDQPIKDGSLIEAYSTDGILCGKGKYNDGILKFMPVYGYDNLDPATEAFPEAGDNFTIHINGQKTNPPLAWSLNGLQIDISTRFTTDVKAIPEKFALYQNSPNPFNPTTQMTFDLPHSAEVKLEIYNILGQKVVSLINRKMEAGTHSITWNSSNYGSGIYIYRLTADDFIDSKKMILLK